MDTRLSLSTSALGTSPLVRGDAARPAGAARSGASSWLRAPDASADHGSLHVSAAASHRSQDLDQLERDFLAALCESPGGADDGR